MAKATYTKAWPTPAPAQLPPASQRLRHPAFTGRHAPAVIGPGLRLLTRDEMLEKTFRGGPTRSCASKLWQCEHAEFCEEEWFCRHHGELLTVHGNGGRPVRPLACIRCGRQKESKMKKPLSELRTRGPTSFDEAQIVRGQFVDAAHRALCETDTRRIVKALEDLRKWGTWLPYVRAHFDGEIRRQERTGATELLISLNGNSGGEL